MGTVETSILPDVIRLDAEEEARRLWKDAVEARESADSSLVALSECLSLGIHAAEILAIHRLQPVRPELPATIGSQLELPPPEVDAERDAAVSERVLQFTDLLDLLSHDGLVCCSPRLHRGWEDRTFSCARSRATAHQAIPLQLDEAARGRLLRLSAYRNRIFRDPPPLHIVPAEVLEGFDDLTRMVGTLRD